MFVAYIISEIFTKKKKKIGTCVCGRPFQALEAYSRLAYDFAGFRTLPVCIPVHKMIVISFVLYTFFYYYLLL